MERVSVVGNSGSGKTTLARQIANAIDAPHFELDAIFHQPGWTELPTEQFRARVDEATKSDRWVVDGNYSVVQDIVWGRADTVVVLCPPRHRVMRRVVARTIRRALLRTELWNGNREPLTNLTSLDPMKNIMVWSWTRHHVYRDRYTQAAADPQNKHLRFVFVRDAADARALMRENV